jgi:hypothetical protein
MAFTKFDEFLYLIVGCYFFFLLVLIIFRKGDYLFSMLIFFFSYIVCNYLNSNCLFILIFIFYFFFKFRDISEKYKFLIIIRWKIPILTVLVFNSYSIHNFFYFMAMCNDPITYIIARDSYGIFNFVLSKTVFNELKVMKSIYEFSLNLFGMAKI